jgi:hypothetical protein
MGKGRGGSDRGTLSATGQGEGSTPQDATGLPQQTGKQAACKEIKGNIFTISTSNKAKDGNMLHKTTDALALYIGWHYGEEATK